MIDDDDTFKRLLHVFAAQHQIPLRLIHDSLKVDGADFRIEVPGDQLEMWPDPPRPVVTFCVLPEITFNIEIITTPEPLQLELFPDVSALSSYYATVNRTIDAYIEAAMRDIDAEHMRAIEQHYITLAEMGVRADTVMLPRRFGKAWAVREALAALPISLVTVPAKSVREDNGYGPQQSRNRKIDRRRHK